MITTEQYRSRIGTFFSSRKPNIKNSCKMFRYKSFYATCVIFVLLMIGGIELNPGPPKSGKSMDDIWEKLERLKSVLSCLPEIKVTLKTLNDGVSSMQKEMEELRENYQTIKSENEKLRSQLDLLEGHSRRSNVVFYNVQEEEGESWSKSEELVKHVMNSSMKLNVKDSDIERAHRIGRKTNGNRPIIVRFSGYKKKTEVLRNSKNLKGTRIRIEEDFTAKIRNVRKELRQFMLEARSSGQFAILRYDKLLINGRGYSLEELKSSEFEKNCSFSPSAGQDTMGRVGPPSSEQRSPARVRHRERAALTERVSGRTGESYSRNATSEAGQDTGEGRRMLDWLSGGRQRRQLRPRGNSQQDASSKAKFSVICESE
jgi:regulator of replication initiation timing